MEALHRDGVLKSIGVSNFDVPLMKELLDFAKVLWPDNEPKIKNVTTEMFS